jgi:hypothetical protein
MQRLVKPNDYVVCLKSVKGSMVVKVVQVRLGAMALTARKKAIKH